MKKRKENTEMMAVGQEHPFLGQIEQSIFYSKMHNNKIIK